MIKSLNYLEIIESYLQGIENPETDKALNFLTDPLNKKITQEIYYLEF